MQCESDDPPKRLQTTRRALLVSLGLAAATGTAAADSAYGGNPSGSAASEYRHGTWSFAPSSVPPEGDRYAWVQRDTSGTPGVEVPSLPTTFSANGAEWSIASDLATAESNASSKPAICVANDGSSALVDSVPAKWTAGGVTHVVASSLSAAESERGSDRPAVLFGQDGGEVVA